MPNPTTHVELIHDLATNPWRGFWGERFIGVTVGLLDDMLTEGAATAIRAGMLYDITPRPADIEFDQPGDSLTLLGLDALRPWYPGEDRYVSLVQRIQSKWDFWTGSVKTGIDEELTAAGYELPTLTVPGDYVTPPDSFTTYWSRFWLEFADGDHPVTGEGVLCGAGDAICGEFNAGPEGLTSQYWFTLQAILRRYKPVQWVCWNVSFELPDTSLINLQVHKRFDDPDYEYHSGP